MALLQLQLTKPGETGSKLKLSTSKGARFFGELYWDSPHDLDVHALLATNKGNGAKVSAYEEVLSAYNIKSASNPNAALVRNADKSFGLPCGSLLHSGDSQNGVVVDIDEVITFDCAKIANGANEIPIIITIHEAVKNGATFGEVKKAGIRLKDESGKVLGEYELSQEFASFNAVQMGSMILTGDEWEFHAMGSGFNMGFDGILEFFS